MGLWREKVKDKPFVPTSLTDIPENLSTIDLAIRVESVLSEYYSNPKEPAFKYDAALTRHFQEISQQVEAGIDTELNKPLYEPNSYEPSHSIQEPLEEPSDNIEEPISEPIDDVNNEPIDEPIDDQYDE
jgi:hypothetical protein